MRVDLVEELNLAPDQSEIVIILQTLLLLVAPLGQVDARARGDEGLLEDAYVDGTYAFSIRPPREWQVIRQRVPERQGVTLLRMVRQVAPNRIEEMRLRQVMIARPVSMDEMLREVHHALELEFSNVEVSSQQLQDIAGSPGAFLAATFRHQGARQLRLEAIVELQPRRRFFLSYTGRPETQPASERLFHLVVGSLRLAEEHVSRTELEKALTAGRTLLAGLDEDTLRDAIVPEEFLKIESDGEVVGFVRIRQGEGTVKKRRGVQSRERGWLFQPDGRARRLQANQFVSYGLEESEWKTSLTACVPQRDDLPARLENSVENAARSGGVLLSSRAHSLNDPEVDNPPLAVPEPFGPRVVLRMLPRLLDDLSQPRRLAFWQFDQQRLACVVRIVELKGVAELPSGAARGEVYLIEDREGRAGEPTSLYVDSAGRVQRVIAGKLRMVPSKPAELESLMGSRVRVAEAEMLRLEKQVQEQNRRFFQRRKPASRAP